MPPWMLSDGHTIQYGHRVSLTLLMVSLMWGSHVMLSTLYMFSHYQKEFSLVGHMKNIRRPHEGVCWKSQNMCTLWHFELFRWDAHTINNMVILSLDFCCICNMDLVGDELSHKSLIPLQHYPSLFTDKFFLEGVCWKTSGTHEGGVLKK